MKKFLLQEPVEVETPKGHRFRLLRHFCKGCRICVAFCPTGTLDLDDRFKITVAHPEKCIACRMCEMRCPDLAIFVTKGPRGQGIEGSSEEVGTKAEGRSQKSEGRRQEAEGKGQTSDVRSQMSDVRAGAEGRGVEGEKA